MNLATMPDADLVARSLNGDQQSFAALYERHVGAIFDFLRRMMRNPAEAEDLAQETFLRAMKRLDTLQNPERFKSWLFSIAHHQALDRLDQLKRLGRPRGADSDGDSPDPLLAQIDPDRLVTPATVAEIVEASELVWAAAEGLDRRQYAILDLHVRHGFESPEIAEALGMSKGHAATLLNRVKNSLEDAIGLLLLMRRRGRGCDRLDEILADVTPRLTPALRRSIDAHVRRCDACQRTRRRLVAPAEMLGAFAAVPVPIALHQRILGGIDASWAEAAASFERGRTPGDSSGTGSQGGRPPASPGASNGGGGAASGRSTRVPPPVLALGAAGLLGAALLSVIALAVMRSGAADGESQLAVAAATATASPANRARATVSPTATAPVPTATNVSVALAATAEPFTPVPSSDRPPLSPEPPPAATSTGIASETSAPPLPSSTRTHTPTATRTVTSTPTPTSSPSPTSTPQPLVIAAFSADAAGWWASEVTWVVTGDPGGTIQLYRRPTSSPSSSNVLLLTTDDYAGNYLADGQDCGTDYWYRIVATNSIGVRRIVDNLSISECVPD